MTDDERALGVSFSELTLEQMQALQGGGDIHPETTPALTIGLAGVGVGILITNTVKQL